jgi:phenylalanyl-tRNA synthetase alpha chain
MKTRIEDIKAEITAYTITNKEELEAFRIKYLGSKGLMKSLFGELKTVPKEEKREVGQLLNGLRQFTQGLNMMS